MNFRLSDPKLLFSLFIALAVAGVAVGFLPSGSGVPLTAQLVGDIPAVRVATHDGETIDCGSQQITSPSLNNGIGILVRNVSNVTVRNCQVRNFWVGLFAENAPGLTVINSNFVSNATLSILDVYSPASPADISNENQPKFFYWPGPSPAPIKDGIRYRTPFTAENSYVVRDDLTDVTNQQFLMIPTDSFSAPPYTATYYVYSGRINKLRGPYPSLPAPYVSGTSSNVHRGGGGIVIQNSSNISIRNTAANDNFSGIELYNVSGAAMENNNLQSNLGFGAFLYNVDGSTIQNNDMQYTGYPARWRQMDGTDNAALMMMYGSDNNQVIGNELSHSPDGLFLSNAESPDYISFGTAASDLTSDNNTFRNNTAEYVPHNAFEVVFSHSNTFENNNASHSKIGFWITYGSGHSLINNTINGSFQYGIALRQVNNYTITGNTITNSGRADDNPDGIGIFMTTDLAHNWKTIFPENANLTITGNNMYNNKRGLIIDGAFHDVTINNTYASNDFNIVEGYNYLPGANVTIDNVRVASRGVDQCETLATGAVSHPYVITFIGGGSFPDKSVLRDGFIPSCSGLIGYLNPANSFPNITRAANLPNLGIFSRLPLSENKNKFSIKFARTAESDFNTGCDSSGRNCDKTAIKNRATSICPDTNMVVLLQNNATFGWTTDNGPNPFTSGNIPLISIGVENTPSRIQDEDWGVCVHEFGHAFAYLADERSGDLTFAQTGYETNGSNIANCALPSECASKFNSSTCVVGCGFSNSLSRPRTNSIMSDVDLTFSQSLTFNQPSITRLSSLLNNSFFTTDVANNTNISSSVNITRFSIKNASSQGNIFPSELRGSFSTTLINEILDNNVRFSFSAERNGINTSPSFLVFSPLLSSSTNHYNLTSDVKSFGGIRPNQTIEVTIKAVSNNLSPSELSRLFPTSVFNISSISYDYYPRIDSSDKISSSWTGDLILTSEL